MLEWSRVNDIEVTVFSVDHNLRAESKLEISYIKKLSAQYGFHFVPLSPAQCDLVPFART